MLVSSRLSDLLLQHSRNLHRLSHRESDPQALPLYRMFVEYLARPAVDRREPLAPSQQQDRLSQLHA